jgi:tRNA(fMet)-specific endonuclease VapC
MTAYLLDTNHASPLVTRGHPLRQRVRDRLAANDAFAICAPVLTETLVGIGMLPRALQNRAEWARFQPLLPCSIPDEIDGEAAAARQLALRRQGRQLATVDALFAAVALRYDLVLLTTDRDF